MGGAVDVVDGIALLTTRGLPKRARLVGLVALSAGIAGLACARMRADERVQMAADGRTPEQTG
jgi:hypothetical protein